jgi:hypothetical protein
VLDFANGSNSRENDRRVLGLTSAGLSRVLLLRVILTGEVLLRVLGLTGEVITSVSVVMASVVMASLVLAVAAAFVRSLILISDWAHRSTVTRHSTIHSTIHRIRGRDRHIIHMNVMIQVAESDMCTGPADAWCARIFAQI